jgi:cephalosporin hydroxylase
MPEWKIEGCPVGVVQDMRELEKLISVFHELNPRRILEIGSYQGGTLWHWMKHAEPGAKIVSVDKLVEPEYHGCYAGESYAKALPTQQAGHGGEWARWAADFGHDFLLIEGDSTDPETVAKVRLAMPEADFVFIDGEHYEGAVRLDLEHYGRLVGPGGVVAFHDINYYGVKQVWGSLREDFRTEEFIADPASSMGIGVLYRPEAAK